MIEQRIGLDGIQPAQRQGQVVSAHPLKGTLTVIGSRGRHHEQGEIGQLRAAVRQQSVERGIGAMHVVEDDHGRQVVRQHGKVGHPCGDDLRALDDRRLADACGGPQSATEPLALGTVGDQPRQQCVETV